MDLKLLNKQQFFLKSFQNINIEISCEDEFWEEEFPNLEEILTEISQEVFYKSNLLSSIKTSANIELSFVFTKNRAIQELNENYRGQNIPTNVLSFPSESKTSLQDKLEKEDLLINDILLGDIVLASGVVRREAQNQTKPLFHHTSHLLVHGLLHLVGYDHVIERDAEIMESLEIEILNNLGIPNPYSV